MEDYTTKSEPPSEEEVEKALGKLKLGRAAGVENLPELLVKGGPTVVVWLHSLINSIWQTMTIPKDWLLGVILPFWKKGPKDQCRNYRDITLLSIPGKIITHIVLKRLRPLLLQKQRCEQSRFTPGRSTTDQVFTLRLLDQNRREYRKPLNAAYVDSHTQMAFDSMDRQTLWKVFRILGVPGKLTGLLSLVYRNTLSCVLANSQTPPTFNINSDLRQGCILAPTIFNTAIDFVMGRTAA